MVNIFTDGGCRFNPGPGAWGFMIQGKCFGDFKISTTNNEMELMAILMALKYIRPDNDESDLIVFNQYKVGEVNYNYDPKSEIEGYRINSDSSYAIGTLTGWAKKWVLDGSIKTRPNGKLVLQLLNELNYFESQGIKIEFNKVKGHSGVAGNEVADKIVNAIMDSHS